MADNKTEYVVLTDNQNRGTVVKCNGRIQHRYDKERKKWIRSGILLEYFCDESPLYNCYEEISEEQALKTIKAFECVKVFL